MVSRDAEIEQAAEAYLAEHPDCAKCGAPAVAIAVVPGPKIEARCTRHADK